MLTRPRGGHRSHGLCGQVWPMAMGGAASDDAATREEKRGVAAADETTKQSRGGVSSVDEIAWTTM